MFTVIGTATVDLFVSKLAAMPRSEGDEFTVDSLVFHDEPLRTSLGETGPTRLMLLRAWARLWNWSGVWARIIWAIGWRRSWLMWESWKIELPSGPISL